MMINSYTSELPPVLREVLGVSLHMLEQFLMVTTNQSVSKVFLFSVFLPNCPCQSSEVARNLGQSKSVFPHQDGFWMQAGNFKPCGDGTVIICCGKGWMLQEMTKNGGICGITNNLLLKVSYCHCCLCNFFNAFMSRLMVSVFSSMHW